MAMQTTASAHSAFLLFAYELPIEFKRPMCNEITTQLPRQPQFSTPLPTPKPSQQESNRVAGGQQAAPRRFAPFQTTIPTAGIQVPARCSVSCGRLRLPAVVIIEFCVAPSSFPMPVRASNHRRPFPDSAVPKSKTFVFVVSAPTPAQKIYNKCQLDTPPPPSGIMLWYVVGIREYARDHVYVCGRVVEIGQHTVVRLAGGPCCPIRASLLFFLQNCACRSTQVVSREE